MDRIILCLVLMMISLSAMPSEDYWNTADSLNRRTCPSGECGVVGKLFFREKATVKEIKNGWARISKYYNASCVNGQSEFVDSGNRACDKKNGIVKGKFAEWVSLKYLSKTRPPDPVSAATGIAALVSASDGFRRHRDAFVKATGMLIKQGRCTASDFKEMGGWLKSTNHKKSTVYFTYCGGFRNDNRIYLDVSDGRVFK